MVWNRISKVMAFFLVMVFVMLAGSSALAATTVNIQSPPVVSLLPILWMKEEGIMADKIALNINISPDHSRALALINKGDIDMMVTGVNVGAKAFNKGIDIKLVNTNIWAIDYLLTNGFKAKSWGDLQGKTLSLPLKGGPLDFLARYFMQENNVNLDEVDIIYKPLANGARSFQLGRMDAIILPEPLVTVTLAKSDNAYLSLDLQKEWAKLHQGEDRIPYVGLFVRGDFAREKSQLTKEFDKYYRQGVKWVNENPDEAAKLAARYFQMPAKIIKVSFKRIDLSCYSRAETFGLIEGYFMEILKMYPEMIGGRLPNENFYF